MSKQNATRFLVEVRKDEKAYASLASMSGTAVEKLAQEMGYPCRIGDLKDVLREARESSQALSDEELEGVAGGAGGQGAATLRGPVSSFVMSCQCMDGPGYPTTWDTIDPETRLSPTTGGSTGFEPDPKP